MKKRAFILLEILIACTLLALCIAPLMQKPIQLYRSQISALENIEKQRLADLAFVEIKEMLLRNQIPWKKLPTSKEKTIEFPLSLAYFQIPHCSPKPIERRAFFTYRREKLGFKGETYLLLDVEIWFGSNPPPKKRSRKNPRFSYQVIVKKVNQ